VRENKETSQLGIKEIKDVESKNQAIAVNLEKIYRNINIRQRTIMQAIHDCLPVIAYADLL
jgi:hypothetical protein